MRPCSRPRSGRGTRCPMAAATAPAGRAGARSSRAASTMAATSRPRSPKPTAKAGFALFCQARPLSDLVIESREVGAVRDIPIKTLPCRVQKMERLAPDVMALYLRLPANERLQFLAGQYIEILTRGRQAPRLLDGERAARRRIPATASAPLHGRHFHRVRVHADEGARHPALRRPLRHLLSARRLRQSDHLSRERHRLRADQGHPGARLPSRHRAAHGAVLGGAHAAGSVPGRAAPAMGGGASELPLRAGALGTTCRGRMDTAARASCIGR